ncbi:MAG: NepR family anti-sigma factor [Pseudomonadota bacterium]
MENAADGLRPERSANVTSNTRDNGGSIPPDPEGEAAEQHNAALDDVLQGFIGERLRGIYDSVANEPVPDKLLDLLRQLEEAEDAAKPEGGES